MYPKFNLNELVVRQVNPEVQLVIIAHVFTCDGGCHYICSDGWEKFQLYESELELADLGFSRGLSSEHDGGEYSED